MADAGEIHRRVQRVIIAHETVGGSRYSAEDALFDITQIYTEAYGPVDRWTEKEK